jgi:hypothetical protein
METSILRSTKKVLGIEPDDNTFDVDIIIFINSALSTIKTLGLGQIQVTDDSAEWEDIVSDEDLLGLIRAIVYLRTRMLFDPPTTSYTQQAMTHQIEELEWRLNVGREDTDWIDPNSPPIVLGG